MIVLGFVYAQLGFHYMSAPDQRFRRGPGQDENENQYQLDKKYSCKFNKMHILFGLNNQDQTLPIKCL